MAGIKGRGILKGWHGVRAWQCLRVLERGVASRGWGVAPKLYLMLVCA